MFDWLLDVRLATLLAVAIIGQIAISRWRREPLSITVGSVGGFAVAMFGLWWAFSLSPEAAAATFLAGLGAIVMTESIEKARRRARP